MKDRFLFVLIIGLIGAIVGGFVTGCTTLLGKPVEETGYTLPQHGITLGEGMELSFSGVETVTIFAESRKEAFVLTNEHGEAIASTPQIVTDPNGEVEIGYIIGPTEWNAAYSLMVDFDGTYSRQVNLVVTTKTDQPFSYHTEEDEEFWGGMVRGSAILGAIIFGIFAAGLAFFLSFLPD